MKKKRKKKRKLNVWQKHVNKEKAKHKSKPLKEILKIASQSYGK